VTGAAARRLLAPEVVQTSSMDCGPAALKCLLEGHGIKASYGRLREACQTSVDGTSIDTIEIVAGQLGLAAEQVLIPADHVLLPGVETLPALLVVRHADHATHFVVAWRRHGPWLQIMDPALGRRWVRADRFRDELFRHEMSLDAADWRAWAASEACLAAWRARMALVGIAGGEAEALIASALADSGWFTAGALDACLRLVQSLEAAGGVRRGDEAGQMLAALLRDTLARTGDIFALVPPAYWSVAPDPDNWTRARPMLKVKGGVLLKIAGLRPAEERARDAALAPELEAALAEPPTRPLRTLGRMIREDGLATPLALAVAMAIATGALMLEALLFRGMLDIGPSLALPSQRLLAGAALILFVALLLGVELAMGFEIVRQGRALEARLRMALLTKLPRLADRYFQSRPITDMADRSHNIQAVRAVPGLGLAFVQSLFELALTLVGVALIAPGSGPWALGIVLTATALPFAVQPLVNERDLRVRNHAGALHGFYLDAILGLAPIRAHRAERNVQRQHESLLVEWSQSLRGLMRFGILTNGVQALAGTGLAVALLVAHFASAGSVGGADLLLIFWVLKLPAIGGRIAGLARSYPAQRNALLRLTEPLDAPEEPAAVPSARAGPSKGAAAVRVINADVVAGGHSILRGISLDIAAGEHVAVVGPSGAGKSSLIGLLLGWHRPAGGRVTLDGHDLDAEALVALRRQTAWIDPAVQIWNRSLLDNLLYATDGGAMERVGEVVEAAQLRGIARKLPNGLQTLLGESGGLLSGGEGQRVRLGRALLTPDPRLALLDEPFRGLDRGHRRQLLGEARAWWSDTTLICVTHDIEETLAFDRVLVIEDGILAEDGRPAALAARPSRYRRLLEAERQVHANLWRGADWRRLRVEHGRVIEGAAA
jgi:ATP-binding cassette subfamily B protein